MPLFLPHIDQFQPLTDNWSLRDISAPPTIYTSTSIFTSTAQALKQQIHCPGSSLSGPPPLLAGPPRPQKKGKVNIAPGNISAATTITQGCHWSRYIDTFVDISIKAEISR